MNREQAKIIGAMTDEQFEAIEKTQWIKNREFIVAFGEGKDIIFCGGVHFAPNFLDPHSRYSIAEPSQTINGIECPMYLKEGDLEDGQEYFVEVIDVLSYSTNHIYDGDEIDSMIIERKIAHLTRENAIKCCKARHGIKE